MYNMQTVMHALCRHVPKSGLQTDTNFLRVGTCSYFYTRSAQLVFCCETRPKTKIKSYRQLLAGRNAAHWQLKYLQVQGKSVSIKEQLIVVL